MPTPPSRLRVNQSDESLMHGFEREKEVRNPLFNPNYPTPIRWNFVFGIEWICVQLFTNHYTTKKTLVKLEFIN
ncbi:hypothetical protein PJP14_29570, partial [Mycobacterium kansasii]